MEEQVDINGDATIYMLRTTQQHHVQLSMMADQKASFLIAASFVVLSILAGYFADGKITYTMLFVAAILLSASVFAILAVMPRHKYRHPVSKTDNILFFGNFSQLALEDFVGKIEDITKNDKEIYRTMLHDIYSMGKVLNDKKYRFLAWSYKIFLVGLLLCPFVAIAEYFLIISK